MTVTLTYDNTLARVRIDANGLGGGVQALVERSTNQITWTIVRGGREATITAGTMTTVDDYEFVDGVVNYYRVTPYDGGVMTDTFTRTVSNGWGTADTGHTWSHPSSTASHFSTNGTKGIVTVATVTDYRRCEPSTSPTMVDFDLRYTVAVNRLAASDWIVAGVSFRHTDDDNRYFARIEFRHSPANTVFATLYRETATVVTELQSVSLGTYVINEVFGLRLSAQASALKFKVWRNAVAEPSNWTIQSVDTDHGFGDTLLMSAVGTASTATLPITFTHDDFEVTYEPQSAGATQSSSITPTLDGVWIKSLGRPFLNRQLECAPGPGPITRRTRGSTTAVIGRSLPVGVAELRGSRELPIDVTFRTSDEHAAFNVIIGTGDPLFIHTPAQHPLPTMYVVVDRSTETRPLLNRRCNDDWRVFTLPLIEVAAPGASVVGSTSTWQTVVNTYATWNDVLADKDTWLELIELVGDVNEVVVP